MQVAGSERSAGTDFKETVRRFRKRFRTSDWANTELLAEFWNRRQAPGRTRGHLGLHRRDGEPLMRQGIIEGLRLEIKRECQM